MWLCLSYYTAYRESIPRPAAVLERFEPYLEACDYLLKLDANAVLCGNISDTTVLRLLECRLRRGSSVLRSAGNSP